MISSKIDNSFGHWLAGFADGEGTFTADRQCFNASGFCVAPRFTLALRDDDAAILYECHARTGLGTIRPITRKKPGNPQLAWTIYSKQHTLSLVSIFDMCPLRAKKARDFAIWREIVILWQSIFNGGRAGWSRERNKTIYENLSKLRDLLMTQRKYPEAIKAQEKVAGNPNHSTVYIPSGTNGIPLVATINPKKAEADLGQ